jgi:catechol 2,3-dioxygenase-like lactoylglutathione lyase family enzyme
MVAALDHVTISAADFAASLRFYDAVLGALELVRLHELRDEEEHDAPVEAAAWGTEGDPPLIWLIGDRPSTTGLHVALQAHSRVEVEAFFRDGIASGGSQYRPPRRWTLYRRGEFHAVVRDPDGNLIEAVCPE